MTWALLQRQRVVALLPASVGLQPVDAAQRVTRPAGQAWPPDRFGLLVPTENAGDATVRLWRFLLATKG